MVSRQSAMWMWATRLIAVASLVLSSARSFIQAFSCHCLARAALRPRYLHQSDVQLRASTDQAGSFFDDGSPGDVFKEAEKPQAGSFFDDGSPGDVFKEAEKPPSKAEKEEEPMSIEELEMLATPFDEHLPKINMVTLVGRVGNDPEPRYFDDGKVVLNLSLAVRRKYHPLERKVRGIRSGEEETDWFALELWGRDAEYVASYVEKGARIGITGSLAQDAWTDRATGEQRRKAKIVVRHTDILESRAEAELRKSNRGSFGNNSFGVGGNSGRTDEDDDGGPAPAGTGGFFN